MHMRWLVLYGLLMITITGCLVSSDTQPGEAALTELTCQQVDANALASIVCIPTERGVLVQTAPGTQVTLNTANAEIVFDSTLYLERNDPTMTIAALDGTGVVIANDSIRIVQAGTQVVLQLANANLRVDGPPSAPRISDPQFIANLPIDGLNRTVNASAPVVPAAQPTQSVPPTTPPQTADSEPEAQPTSPPSGLQPVEVTTAQPNDPEAVDAACVPPADWTNTYTIRRGDNLTRLAVDFDIPVEDIIKANCIDNPDRITAGQVLAVPELRTAGEDAGIVTDDDSASSDDATPGATFTAERDVIVTGDCIDLSWAVTGARSVELDGSPVAQEDTVSVCPLATTNYNLLVNFQDGTQTGYTVTITVTE